VARVTVEERDQKASLNNPGGSELVKRVGGDNGLPFFAFLASDGSLIVNSIVPPQNGKKGGNIGHPYEPHEVDWFMVMLSKAAPAMSPDEKAVIEKYLRAQKK